MVHPLFPPWYTFCSHHGTPSHTQGCTPLIPRVVHLSYPCLYLRVYYALLYLRVYYARSIPQGGVYTQVYTSQGGVYTQVYTSQGVYPPCRYLLGCVSSLRVYRG